MTYARMRHYKQDIERRADDTQSFLQLRREERTVRDDAYETESLRMQDLHEDYY